MSNKEFNDQLDAAYKARIDSGKSVGPTYSKKGQPARWYQQVFERALTPADTVECAEPQRVGSTMGALNIALVGNASNTEAVVAASGATITAILLQSDKHDGVYEEVGPTICVKAPADGMSADPGMLLCRFALGDFNKPWLKVKLVFAGTIAGGTLDCILDYNPR